MRTYWSPEAVERVTGWKPDGLAADGFIHLINSGAATLDGSGECESDGKPAMKPWWEITEEEAAKCLEATICYGDRLFPRRRISRRTSCAAGGMPVTMCRLNLVEGLGPVLQIAEGYTVELPADVHTLSTKRTDPTWPTTWFVPRLTGKGAFKDVYRVMNNWGANHGAFSYGHIGADLITLRVDAAHPGLHAQRAEDDNFPSERVERLRHQGSRRARTTAPARTSAGCTNRTGIGERHCGAGSPRFPKSGNVPRIVRFSGRFHTLPLCTGAPPHEPTDAHD